MWLSILGLVAKPILYIVEWWYKKHAHDDAARRDYIAFLEIMHKKGIVSVQMRLESEKQINEIAAAWAEEKAKKEPNGP